MGYTISGILIDKLPEAENLERFNSNIDKINYSVNATNALCPKNLTIGFKNNSTFISLNDIYYKNISGDAALTPLELDLCEIFPNTGFLVIVMNETSDIYGYSFVNRGEKLRTKCVTKGQQFLDFGELNPLEQKLQKEIAEYLDKNPATKEHVDKHTKSMTSLEAAKFHLVFRDKLYSRNNLENPYEYLGGSLDSYIIEKMIESITKCDFEGLENTEAIVFRKAKVRFGTESLGDFVKTAFNTLKPKST
jgi:hypothetical protein